MKDQSAVQLGRKGGLATNKKLSKEQRTAKMKHALKARWDKFKEVKNE